MCAHCGLGRPLPIHAATHWLHYHWLPPNNFTLLPPSLPLFSRKVKQSLGTPCDSATWVSTFAFMVHQHLQYCRLRCLHPLQDQIRYQCSSMVMAFTNVKSNKSVNQLSENTWLWMGSERHVKRSQHYIHSRYAAEHTRNIA